MSHFESLVATLKKRRKMLNITQDQLAELSGVGLRSLKEIESGKGNPTLATMHKLIDALGLEFELKPKSINADS